MLPQVVVRRALRLDVDKVGTARARVSRGPHAQREESVIRHVVRELAEQRRAELIKARMFLSNVRTRVRVRVQRRYGGGTGQDGPTLFRKPA